MLRYWKDHTLGCGLSIIRLIVMIVLPPWNWLIWLKKVQPPLIRRDGLIDQATIGTKQQPTCILRNSAITILGCTNKLWPRITCLVEQLEHHNLPLGKVVNRCVAIPKARAIPIILVNMKRFNVWVMQTLLAAELHDVECSQIDYRATMNWEKQKQIFGSNLYLPI